MGIAVKRVYEKATRADGTRVLVDRLWPRGLSKENARVHAWLRELAPSNGLRQWFHAHPEGWAQFRKLYLKELMRPETEPGLEKLHGIAADNRRVTLLFASKNEIQNNAVVLKELLEGMRKPPTGTGPGAVKVLRQRHAARKPS
jgi:uncharacterized protein YeaO (DUF488 family)